MRAIIIHSDSRMIVEADIDGGLESLQKLVGGHIEPVYVGLPGEHHCYIDEEGLFKHPRAFFMFRDGHQPLAGTGVILGTTEDGNEAACTVPLDWAQQNVTFMDLWEAQEWARTHQ